jgi:SAM-dependent methyltransferase
MSSIEFVSEHVVDGYVVLENIYDALKPGGYLVFHERTWQYYIPGRHHYRLDGAWRDHPIRIKTPIMDHFTKHFDIIYYTDSSPKWTVCSLDFVVLEKFFYNNLVMFAL